METFVIRVWRAADHEAAWPETWPAPLRGIAEHVATGDRAPFAGGEELIRFLRHPRSVADTSGGIAADIRELPLEGDPA